MLFEIYMGKSRIFVTEHTVCVPLEQEIESHIRLGHEIHINGKTFKQKAAVMKCLASL